MSDSKWSNLPQPLLFQISTRKHQCWTHPLAELCHTLKEVKSKQNSKTNTAFSTPLVQPKIQNSEMWSITHWWVSSHKCSSELFRPVLSIQNSFSQKNPSHQRCGLRISSWICWPLNSSSIFLKLPSQKVKSSHNTHSSHCHIRTYMAIPWLLFNAPLSNVWLVIGKNNCLVHGLMECRFVVCQYFCQ